MQVSLRGHLNGSRVSGRLVAIQWRFNPEQLTVDAVAYAPFPSRVLSRTRLAGVVRWRGQQRAAAPFHLVGELLPELVPALV